MCVGCALVAAVPRPPVASDEVFPPVADPWPLPPVGVRVVWSGVAGFVFEAEGTRIAFDPFASRPGLFATLFRPAAPAPGVAARVFPALDAVFTGHAHFDHALDLEAIAAVTSRCRFHGGPTVTELGARRGIPRDRLVATADGDVVEVGPFRVEAIRAEHGVVPVVRHLDRLGLPARGLPWTPFRWPRGEVFAWRVDVRGRSFQLHGSAGLAPTTLERSRPADVLVACLAARKGTPGFLARLGERLHPKVLVPCHHDDFFRPLSEPPRPIPTLRWPAFLEEAAALRAAHGTALVRPVRGATVEA